MGSKTDQLLHVVEVGSRQALHFGDRPPKLSASSDHPGAWQGSFRMSPSAIDRRHTEAYWSDCE